MKPRRNAARAALLLLPLCLISGCSSAKDASSPDAALPAARVDASTSGSVTGSVRFTGTPPAMPSIDMSANPACERQHHAPQKSEQVVVNPNGTLRYTFVWIAEGLPKARWTPPATPAQLDQNGCVYRPHVLGIMTGQPLEISNGDPVNHNVHAESSVNAAWNESQPPRAEKKLKSFRLEEVLFPVTCSVHPWMKSYIGVVSHPFFVVTGEDGAFALNGVPPGSYTIEAVHEKYGRKRVNVTLEPRGNKIVGFEYGS